MKPLLFLLVASVLASVAVAFMSGSAETPEPRNPSECCEPGCCDPACCDTCEPGCCDACPPSCCAPARES